MPYRFVLYSLLITGCTTYRTNEQIARDPKPVQYATESHFWMVPVKQQDGYTPDPAAERAGVVSPASPPCKRQDADSEPCNCKPVDITNN